MPIGFCGVAPHRSFATGQPIERQIENQTQNTGRCKLYAPAAAYVPVLFPTVTRIAFYGLYRCPFQLLSQKLHCVWSGDQESNLNS